jgi:UDP-GlcNAc:undecaprenyl-phosphate GlcNAc-1-phosphate transferase
MIDQPGARKIHLKPTPLLGGISMYVAILFSLLGSYPILAQSQLYAFILGATLLLLVGTADDRGLLHHQIKLFVAMPAASLIVLGFGIRAQVFSSFFPGRFGSLADALLTVFWITGITAAFSILDYMDGVCAGSAAIASLFIALVAFLNDQLLVSLLAAAVAGAALGFLCWNFAPAKIFMGDGGAMMLGFLQAILALTLRLTSASRSAAWLTPLFILALPRLDTTLVSVSRLRRGLIPFTSPGKDHLGHRLANCGMGIRGSVLAMYALAVICGSIAVVCKWLNGRELAAISLAGLFFLAACVVLFERLPYERQESKPSTFA